MCIYIYNIHTIDYRNHSFCRFLPLCKDYGSPTKISWFWQLKVCITYTCIHTYVIKSMYIAGKSRPYLSGDVLEDQQGGFMTCIGVARRPKQESGFVSN